MSWARRVVRWCSAGVVGRLGLSVGLLLGTGCHFLRSPEVPMPNIGYGDLGPERARGVVILLPGLGDAATEFEARGFVAEILARREFDVVAVDAHFGYYRNQSVAQRVLFDIVGPARRRGYREVWLLGISLGGFGALEVLRIAADQITGSIVLAPYLGPEEVSDDVRGAGGIRRWRPKALDEAEDAEARSALRVWQWLKRADASGTLRNQLYLGFGERDRFAAAHRLLQEVLPAGQALAVAGGHDWDTWRVLFENLGGCAWDRGSPRRQRPCR